MSKPDKIQADKAIGLKNDLGKYTLNHKSFILYALGIGFSTGSSPPMQTPTRSRTSSTPTNTMTNSPVTSPLRSLPHSRLLPRPGNIHDHRRQ